LFNASKVKAEFDENVVSTDELISKVEKLGYPADLVAEDTRQAVAAWRDPFSAESGARAGELAMGERRPGR
ncbi:hypothetical protein ABT356_38840, partial [Streptosporangium roseum]